MRPSVFISRSEKRSKTFLDRVKGITEQVLCESLIDFSIVNAGALPDNGWLFFYSQTGVDLFLRQYSSHEVIARNLKVAAFGPKTGEYILDHNLHLDFIGTGEATSTGRAFLGEGNMSHVCFIKGMTSKNSLYPILEGHADLSTLVVYDNIGKTQLDVKQTDILVFTSPLNLKTYHLHKPINSFQKVIVIGTSTAIAAISIGIPELRISRKPSIESLADEVIALCETWSH